MLLLPVALRLLVGVLLLPLALRILRHIVTVTRVMYKTRRVPGPPSMSLAPGLGCLPTFMDLWRDAHGTLLNLLNTWGSTLRFRVVDRVVLVVMDPDDVQAVCTHPALANKPVEYEQLLGSHLGNGLLNMNGTAHRRHRKAITPSLHLEILNDFVPTFAKNCAKMADRLAEHADSGLPFNIQPEFGRLTSSTFMETVLSSQSASEEELAERLKVFNDTSDLLMWRGLRGWWANDTIFNLLSSRAPDFRRTAAKFDEMVSVILHAKIQEVAKGVAPPPRRRMAFLDHVLRSKESALMTADELRDELKTFLFVGTTTSMDFLSVVMVVLSMLPDVQSKVHEELDRVFGAPGTPNADRPLTPDDIGHLEYTERVLREVLRYVPPVPIVFRTASEDVRLPGGTLVPKGCYVALVPAGTHRLEQHFPDPLRFDPDRFLPENSRGRHPYAFVPFSAGSRNCIGLRYALMLAKTATATLLRKYTLSQPPEARIRKLRDLEVDMGITVSIRGGAHVCVRRRV